MSDEPVFENIQSSFRLAGFSMGVGQAREDEAVRPPPVLLLEVPDLITR
jgi:hypothetical protein